MGSFGFTPDDDDDDEAMFIALAAEGDSTDFVNNADHWNEDSLGFSPLDVVVCAAGLAANISTSFAVFFKDLRRDLCAARNNSIRRGVVEEFDADLQRLPVAAEQA